MMNFQKVAFWVGTLSLASEAFAIDSDFDTCEGLWCGCAIMCFPTSVKLGRDADKDPDVDRDCLNGCRTNNPDLYEECEELYKFQEEDYEHGEDNPFEFFACDGNNFTLDPTMSPPPSGTPSTSQVPSVSASPTINCKCCDCTHSSGCTNDPHYRTWNNDYYDFQGACDQKAIDNGRMQLQIRTRPRGVYSTVVEVGLIMKLTGEVFHAVATASGLLVLTNTITSASNAAYSNQGSNWHKISFSDVSFILVRGSGSGMNVEASGRGVVFTDSQGMFGSWNTGGARFSNGTIFDLSGSYPEKRNTAIQLAESWKVSAGESLMQTPSDICIGDSSCGGASDLFPCDEFGDGGQGGDRRLGQGSRKLQLQNPECKRTCDDIVNPVLKEFCEKDVELTEDPSWACDSSYVDPVIVESNECEFETSDDEMCHKTGDTCQRMGGSCKLDCKSTDDHVCVRGLCAYEGAKNRFLGRKGNKGSKVPKSAKSTKRSKCECFVPVKCESAP